MEERRLVVLPIDIIRVIRATHDVIVPFPSTISGGKMALPMRTARDVTVAALRHGNWPSAGICQWLRTGPNTFYRIVNDPDLMGRGRQIAEMCDEAYRSRLGSATIPVHG